ncbi:crossover junction endodeoxyribonuclease RuvC [gamma proteobacterium HTCC5015]|nr:crossover junction endodeoxyribonuclease RuvC [gamma proteobacterium HTCC5015]
MAETRRILGIDPGSVTMGLGVVEVASSRQAHLYHAAVKTGGGELPKRLGVIVEAVAQVIVEWQPDEVAIEEVFVSANAMSALKLGQARGAAICAAVQAQLPVSEYSARQVKQSVVGTGAASKDQVQHMVKALLQLEVEALQADAADALAIALCHAHSRTLRVPMGRRGNRRRGARRAVSEEALLRQVSASKKTP